MRNLKGKRKTEVCLMGMAILCILSIRVNATTIDFYEDGTITDNNSFDVVRIHNDVTVDMFGGYVGDLYSWPISTFNMYDGTVMSLLAGSFAHLRGGYIDTVVQGGEVHIYGYNFVWTLGDPNPQRGTLTGNWADETPFSMNLRDIMPGDPDIVLHEIPEPASILLFSLIAIPILKRIS